MVVRWLIPILCAQLVLPACAVKKPVTPVLPTVPTNDQALDRAHEGLPKPPDRIPADKNWAIGMEATETHPEGILISPEKAAQASEYAIAYDGIRGEYALKTASWYVQEAVYQRNLAEADIALEEANKRAKRTWWEQNDAQIGFLLGAVSTGLLIIGFQAALNGVENAPQP